MQLFKVVCIIKDISPNIVSRHWFYMFMELCIKHNTDDMIIVTNILLHTCEEKKQKEHNKRIVFKE